jgi:histidyl-tRNA synthetase
VDEVLAALELVNAHAPLPDTVEVEVDLSLARGLRYYTGLVFEMYIETSEGPLQVCGGGRYDDLVRALGGRESVPACGFSYGLERVDLARDSVDSRPAQKRVLVVGVDMADHPDAVRIAAQLRSLSDVVVEQDLRLRGVKSALRYADRAGFDQVVIVGARERELGNVVLRNMRTRSETTIAREALREALA